MELWDISGDTEYVPLGWMMGRVGNLDFGEISRRMKTSLSCVLVVTAGCDFNTAPLLSTHRCSWQAF